MYLFSGSGVPNEVEHLFKSVYDFINIYTTVNEHIFDPVNIKWDHMSLRVVTTRIKYQYSYNNHLRILKTLVVGKVFILFITNN